jgi:hypothetical protein
VEFEWFMFRISEITTFTMIKSDNYFLNDFDFVKLTDCENMMRSKIELKVNYVFYRMF